MSDKPKGGRGKVAPYKTTTIRIPIPIQSDIERIVDNYRSSVNQPILAAIAEIEHSPKNILSTVESARDGQCPFCECDLHQDPRHEHHSKSCPINMTDLSSIPLNDAIVKAHEILADKKMNKKVTIKKLLEIIYGQKVSLDNL